MTWLDDLTLMCLVRDNTVYRYNINAELIEPSLRLGRNCLEESIVDCLFLDNGIVWINDKYELLCLMDFKQLDFNLAGVTKLADLPVKVDPYCIAAIDPKHTSSGTIKVLLAFQDYVLSIDEEKMEELGKKQGPFLKMVVSKDGRSVASYTKQGMIVVTPTDFTDVIYLYDSKSSPPVQQLAWCGPDIVLVCSGDSLLMVGPEGQPVKYPYNGRIVLVSECDGVRVLSNKKMEFIHKVPDKIKSIFEKESVTPEALLYHAQELSPNQKDKANEYLRRVNPFILEAIEACIDAAGHEFCFSRQASLLSAADLGQKLCSNFPLDHIQETRKTLEVLNSLRRCEIGIPVTLEQYKNIPVPNLIGRLISFYHHFQVPLLLNIKQEDVALIKAAESGDANLVYLVLFHLLEKGRPSPEIYELIQANPLVRDLFITYLRSQNRDHLMDFFKLSEKMLEAGLLSWEDSWKFKKNETVGNTTPLRIGKVKLAQDFFASKNEHGFESREASAHAELLSKQQELETQTGKSIFVGSSLYETVRGCIVLGYEEEALKLKTEFKVSNETWFSLKVLALTAKGDWVSLERMSKEGIPKPGYKLIVKACIDAENRSEALKYIPKLDLSEQAKAYVRLGMTEEAWDAAKRSKDKVLLDWLKILDQNDKPCYEAVRKRWS